MKKKETPKMVTQYRKVVLVATLCCLALTSLAGCGKKDDVAVAGGSNGKPAPAPSVDMNALPPQTRQAAEAAIAQGKYEQQKASAEGAAYMEAMKRMKK